MAGTYLKDGEDFGPKHFPKDFGFGKSSEATPSVNKPHHSKPTHADGHQGDSHHLSHEGAPEGEGYAKGGHHEGHHMHPHGHHVTHVEHGEHGVIMHHAHGGMTVHHHDGHVTHHHHDGSEAHHAEGGSHEGPGEGTYLEEKARGGGMPGMRPHLPRGMQPKAERMHSPINTPPRPPSRNPTARNSMPGDAMPYGVEPSAEPDMAGSGQGIPQLHKGGKSHKARGGHHKNY